MAKASTGPVSVETSWRMMRASFPPAALAAVLAACGPASQAESGAPPAPATSAEAGDSVTDAATAPLLAIGQRGIFAGVAITPLRVIEDSRCPTDVDCAWPGRILLSIRIEQEQTVREETIETPMALDLGGMLLTLQTVEPVRTAQNRTAVLDYRFGFSVSQPPLPAH